MGGDLKYAWSSKGEGFESRMILVEQQVMFVVPRTSPVSKCTFAAALPSTFTHLDIPSSKIYVIGLRRETVRCVTRLQYL